MKAKRSEVPFEDGNSKSGVMEVLGPGRWAVSFDIVGGRQTQLMYIAIKGLSKGMIGGC